MYEKLKRYLDEWEIYKNESKDGNLPERLAEAELISIARAVKVTLAEMHNANGEFSKVTSEDQKKIDEVFDFLELYALNKQ